MGASEGEEAAWRGIKRRMRKRILLCIVKEFINCKSVDYYQFLINVQQLRRGHKPNLPKRQRTPFREVRLEAPRMGVMQTLPQDVAFLVCVL
jgi:hypothetical protein